MSISSQIAPFLSPELLSALDQLFPNQQPSLEDSDRKVWFKVGERHAVDVLWAIYRGTQDNPLDQEILTDVRL